MFSFSKKPQDHIDLILDIQSSVICGALMLVRHGSAPRILWTKSVIIPYRPQDGSAYLIKMGVKGVEDIAAAANIYVHDAHGEDLLPGRITSVHCCLSSPWVVSRARTVSQKFSEETRMTKKIISEIIKSERDDLVGKDQTGLTSIEENIFDVRLNGYSVREWKDKSARSLEVSFTLSLAGTEMIELFKEAARRAGPHEDVRFHSSLLLQYMGISSALSINDPYMFIHVHGELTDIVIADAHSCILSGSYPIGYCTIVRKVAQALKISYAVADSSIAIHASGKSDLAHDRSFATSIADASHEWQAECAKLISIIPKERLPSMVMISSREHEDLFNDIIKDEFHDMKSRDLSSDEFGVRVSFDARAERSNTVCVYAIAITNLEAF